jgi:hypothetical protein
MVTVIMLRVVTVNVVMLSLVMGNVIMLSIVMVSVIFVCGYGPVVMLSVIKVNFIVLSVIMVAECHSRVSLHNKLDRFCKTYLHYLGNSSSQTPSLTCERGGLRQVRLFKTH